MALLLEWEELAKRLGYESEKQMLTNLYEEEGLSVKRVAEKLGAGPATILRRLGIYGINKRPRGGANSPAKQRLKLHLMDQRLLMSQSHTETAKQLGASYSVVYKHVRQKKGVRINAILHNQSDTGVEPVFNKE